jgi:hypothetical protein
MTSGFKDGHVELDVIQPLFMPGKLSIVHRVVLEEQELRTFGVVRENRHIFMLVAKPQEGIVEGVVSPQSNPVIKIVRLPSEELADIHSRMQEGAKHFRKKEAKSALLELLRASRIRFKALEATEPDLFHPNVRMSRDIESMASDVRNGWLRGVKPGN